MLADRHGYAQRVKGLRRRGRKDTSSQSDVDRLWERIRVSQTLADRRRSQLPIPAFPAELPITERWEEIAGLIEAHQVIILCGETGSGKSTQLPKICLALGRGVFGRIGHTQPRRIAARSLASRISEELGRELGTSVGYKVRFHDRVSPETHVKLMTDGMLLAEVQQDRLLVNYDTLILDEAHERSLNIDFLLGYLKNILPRRPDLKLIITSATIDPERFSRHFDDAPIINVSGRTFPVEVHYRPPGEEGGGERDEPLQDAILDAVDDLSRSGRGDILVFLSGEREIRETAEHLRKHKLHLTEILPLYARLGRSEQTRIFHPSGNRRIILSTNVAETSLTVPGIHYVIDPGFARISRYSHRSKVQRLPVEAVSQASANQRKGRCGRVAEGICIRLYSEEDFLSRGDYTEPEIQRTNLASVILQMKILGFGEIETFPFIDPPDKRLIKDGYRVLEEIGAIGGDLRVTGMGRQLARLPVDPRIGRMLLEAAHTHCLEEVLVIAAALSIQDPRERPLEKQQAADEAHQPFTDEQSDFIRHLKLWRYLGEQRRHLSRRKFQHLCRDGYLSWTRVQEWRDIHHQLRGQMHEMGYKENQAEAGYEEIHKAILSGLLSNIGFRASGRDREYQGARGSRFMVFPGSGLFRKQPKWVMAAELVETSRLYARTVAIIKPEWIEKAAAHLVKKGYSEPHWERDHGQVAAYVRINLFGLTLIPRRKVNYGPIEPEVSREIFIRSALVDGDFKTRAPFWRHNRELIEYVEHLEHKSRRRDLLVDEEVIYEYYHRRIPEGIYSTPQFDQWLRGETRSNPKLLHMRQDDLIRERLEAVSDGQFPDRMDVNGTPLPLDYRFEPGHGADGVTLKIPLPMMNQVSAARCDWLVPGLLRERIVALLRSLPKQLRRAFVPIPEVADACLRSMQPSDTPLIRALGEQLKVMTGVHVPEDAWREESLPDYLKMHYLVVDEKGQRLDASRDLVSLQKRLGGQGDRGYRKHTDTGFDREGITRWDFGPLPESIEIRRGGIALKGYPALVDKKDSAALRVLDSAENARRAHRAGLRRLFMLAMSKDVRYLRRNLTGLEPMRLQYSKAAAAPPGLTDETGPDLENQLVVLILDLTFIEGMPPVRDSGAFEQRISERKGRLMDQTKEALGLVRDVLEGYQEVRKLLSGITQVNWKGSVSDISQQLDRLVYQGFLAHTPYPQLRHIPRYLKALKMRLEKLGYAAPRDRQLTQELHPLYSRWREWDEKCRTDGRVDERIEELRWHLEELRVSLFAQELGTAYPVSLKRVEKRWKELGL